MANKARNFEREQLLERPKRPSGSGRKPKAGGAAPKRPGTIHTAARHPSGHGARGALVALEDSATKPSRKSTRKGKHRSRPSETLERREKDAKRSPEARARVSIAKNIRVRGHARG
jgi:hypothetical protein